MKNFFSINVKIKCLVRKLCRISVQINHQRVAQTECRPIHLFTILLLKRPAHSYIYVKIDLTLFLDLPPELGFARKGGADKNDRLENEKLDFHKRVYEGYLAVAEKNKDRVVKIDSSKNVDEVFEQIVTAMKKAGVV